jgi:6,7-dimethyl-8-ribityllumazine synthase
MVKTIEGGLDAKGFKFGIVVSRFNDFITAKLLEGAVDALIRHGAEEENIEVVRVPGAFEIPMTARRMVASNKYDAMICLGAVIRGATPHFKGVGAVALGASIPVLFGILTTDNLEQAIERSGAKSGNKGWETGLACIEMVNLYKKI